VSTSAYHPQVETGIRPFDLSRDLGPVAELIAVSFARELNGRGAVALREMRAMSHFGGLLGVLNRSTGEFNDFLSGFVWVDRGTVVGNVTVQRADKYATRWQIANVAVAPAYRGRGISRQLVEKALEHATQAGGQWAVLQVYAGNTVARHLYQSLGFEDVGGIAEVRAARVPSIEKPSETKALKTFVAADWTALYELASHQMGPLAQWWRGIQLGDFQMTFESRLAEWFWNVAGRNVVYRRAVQNSSRFEAALLLTARHWRGEHTLQLWARPEQYGLYDLLLLDWALWQLQEFPRWPVCISVSIEQRSLLDHLAQVGFVVQRTLMTMRCRLAEASGSELA